MTRNEIAGSYGGFIPCFLRNLQYCLLLLRYSAHFSIGVVWGFFVVVELYILTVYFGNEALIGHKIFKYFLPSIGCLFILFMISFAVQKFLHLIRPHLFIFPFISVPLGD